jgi:hypothetical protein
MGLVMPNTLVIARWIILFKKISFFSKPLICIERNMISLNNKYTTSLWHFDITSNNASQCLFALLGRT